MNTNKGYLALLLSLFTGLASSNAFSKFMVEPRAQRITGSFEVGSESGNFSGVSAGLNLGYMNQFFMAGISLEKGEFEYDSNLTTDGYKKFKGGGVGTYLGFQLWDTIRIITTYLNSSLEPSDNDDIRYFGQHASFGIGYRVWRGLMLNYEVFRNQFTQLESDVSGKTGGLDSNIKTEGTNIYLSYILAF